MTSRKRLQTPLYLRWRQMHARCRSYSRDYKWYGAKGIKVCERWNTFEAFAEDMGIPPEEGMSLDRIDNTKGYSPENCRWATAKQQNRNQSRNRFVTIEGETRCVAEWAEISGKSKAIIRHRLLRGMEPKEAVFGQLIKTRPRKSV